MLLALETGNKSYLFYTRAVISQHYPKAVDAGVASGETFGQSGFSTPYLPAPTMAQKIIFLRSLSNIRQC